MGSVDNLQYTVAGSMSPPDSNSGLHTCIFYTRTCMYMYIAIVCASAEQWKKHLALP